MTDLRGMRVLLTGASSGIGAVTARLLAERGADVALLARGRKGLDEVAAAVREQGSRAVVLPCDHTDRPAVEKAVEAAAEQLGGLDAVILNAGTGAYGLFVEMAPEDFERALDITFLGSVNVTRAALPHLERSAGTIVATGSVASQWPHPLMANYAAAKHALRGFLNSLRLELRATGSPVKVAMVHPGPVDTPFWNNVSPVRSMPPLLPSAYRPETVAEALVEALRQPKPERIVGFAMRAAMGAFLVARPAFEAVLTLTIRQMLRNPRKVESGNALYSATGDGRLDGGVNDEPRSVRSG